MSQNALNELRMREELLRYMKEGYSTAIDYYLELNHQLECGIALPLETLFSIACDNIFNGIDEEVLFSDESSRTELLLSRVIVDGNPYKLEFVYTVEQRDMNGSLLYSEDYEIGKESEILQLLEDLGVVDANS